MDCDFREEDNFLPLEIPDGAANPEDRLLTPEIRKILVKTLQIVRPGLRMVFVLHDMEGFIGQDGGGAGFEPNCGQGTLKASQAETS